MSNKITVNENVIGVELGSLKPGDMFKTDPANGAEVMLVRDLYDDEKSRTRKYPYVSLSDGFTYYSDGQLFKASRKVYPVSSVTITKDDK